jgi:hypothetical protein
MRRPLSSAAFQRGKDKVKQADTVMLSYPWAYDMPHNVQQNDLSYYQSGR